MRMKKSTLMIVAALIAVTAHAQNMERAQLARPMQDRLSMMSRPIQGKPWSTIKHLKKVHKAHKAASVSSVEDLTGTWIQIYYSYYEETFISTVMEITKTKGSNNKIIISGWWDRAAEPIEATVDLKAGTISIAPQLLYEYEGDEPAELVNATTEGAALIGTIEEDGSITFEDEWVAQLLGKTAKYEYAAATSLVRPNGKMNFVNEGELFSIDIYVEQEEEGNKVFIFNFGDYGRMIELELNSNQTFSAPSSQVVYYGGMQYGDFILYGINGDDYADITGTGTETILTFDLPWSGVNSEGFWFGENEDCTITLTDGTTFIYPEEDPAGISQVNAAQQNGGKAFNLAGQQVKQGYKGIVIKDGKKFVIK